MRPHRPRSRFNGTMTDKRTFDSMNNHKLIQRFHQACRLIPAPGNGCHAALLGAASRGVFAGLSEEQIAGAIRAGIPAGGRVIPKGEIIEAIRKAQSDVTPCGGGGGVIPRARLNHPRPRPPFRDWLMARASIIAKGGAHVDPDDVALRESSPVELDANQGLANTVKFLRQMYQPDEFVFIGARYDAGPRCIKPAASWANTLEAYAVWMEGLSQPERERAEDQLGVDYPHIIANPLTGEEGPTKKGTRSFRADSCVASYRFVVAEFDSIPKAEQISFFRGLGLPVSALIDTGGKSIHAWLRVDARDVREWEAQIEGRLFPNLAKFGVDGSCKNESRMSRLPGVRRVKEQEDGTAIFTGSYQRLLWLCPGGRPL